MITVITVCRNAGATIERTLRSIAAQTLKDRQYIIIDGASDDGTLEVIERYRGIVDHLVSEPDGGIYDAMNKGLKLARGDLVTFLNGDDRYNNDHVLADVDALARQTGAACVIGNVAIVDPERPDRAIRHYRSKNFRKWMFRFGHMPPHPSTFVRREHLAQIGGFREDFRIGGDFDLMLRLFLSEGFEFAPLDEILVVMDNGGIGNRGLKAKILQNAEDLISLRDNGVWSNNVLIWSKYLIKPLQFFHGLEHTAGQFTNAR